MHQDQPADDDQTPDPALCQNCQSAPWEGAYATNLCAPCRNSLIKFPIPRWLMLFAGGIVAVMVFSLFRADHYFYAAIHLGRAEKAMDAHRFLTAQREIGMVLQRFPGDKTANAEMVIAASYNNDVATTSSAFTVIADKTFDDEDLVARVGKALDHASMMLPHDTATYARIQAAAGDHEKLLALDLETDTVSNDPALKATIANYLFELKDYEKADDIMTRCVQDQADYWTGLSLLSAIKREKGDYDGAIRYCNQLLDINREDVYALAHKARIELKRKHDKVAETFAKQAMALSPLSDIALEAAVLVNHFTGRKKDEARNLVRLREQAAAAHDSTILNRVTPVLTGAVAYR